MSITSGVVKHNPKSMVHHDYTLLFKSLESVKKNENKICIKFIQSDSKYIYNDTEGSCDTGRPE